MTTDIVKMNEEIKVELEKPQVMGALVATTFKGLEKKNIFLAIQEGIIRGFKFEDFLEKNVYAIPFNGRNGQTYSLVTSIDYARKLGMRSKVVGKTAPVYESDDNGKVISCEVTVKRKVDDYIGEYSAKVYFDEYYKAGYNGKPSLWDTKPRTMLAKVAEMHALRAACPEEMSQVYVEEEFQQEHRNTIVPPVDVDSNKAKLEATTNLEELQKVWASIPAEAKKELKDLKEKLKAKFTTNENA